MINDESVQVNTTHYKAESYNSRERYYSYIEQVVETVALEPKQVIEIGVGNGYTTRELRSFGIEVTTVDFDSSLQPDLVASVCDIPLKDNVADVCLCFQVLEHLPFDQFVPAVKELARVSRKWVFLSLPDCRPALGLSLTRGVYHPRAWRILQSEIPGRKPVTHEFDGQHYWEIGKAQTPEKRVVAALIQSGMSITRHYRLHLNPYHHFFLLQKGDR